MSDDIAAIEDCLCAKCITNEIGMINLVCLSIQYVSQLIRLVGCCLEVGLPSCTQFRPNNFATKVFHDFERKLLFTLGSKFVTQVFYLHEEATFFEVDLNQKPASGFALVHDALTLSPKEHTILSDSSCYQKKRGHFIVPIVYSMSLSNSSNLMFYFYFYGNDICKIYSFYPCSFPVCYNHM
jgi:hypothetical protein